MMSSYTSEVSLFMFAVSGTAQVFSGIRCETRFQPLLFIFKILEFLEFLNILLEKLSVSSFLLNSEWIMLTCVIFVINCSYHYYYLFIYFLAIPRSLVPLPGIELGPSALRLVLTAGPQEFQVVVIFVLPMWTLK